MVSSAAALSLLCVLMTIHRLYAAATSHQPSTNFTDDDIDRLILRLYDVDVDVQDVCSNEPDVAVQVSPRRLATAAVSCSGGHLRASCAHHHRGQLCAQLSLAGRQVGCVCVRSRDAKPLTVPLPQ